MRGGRKIAITRSAQKFTIEITIHTQRKIPSVIGHAVIHTIHAVHIIEKIDGIRFLKIEVNPNSSLFARYENGDEDHQILLTMRDDVTNTMIDNMAVVMDLVIPDGEISHRYDDLKRAIQTKQRYEQNTRLR